MLRISTSLIADVIVTLVYFSFCHFLNLDLIYSLHCQVDTSCLTKIILFKTDTLSKSSKILSVRKEQYLNMQNLFYQHSIYSVNLRIQFEYRKIRTRKNAIIGHFSRSASDVDDIPGFYMSYYCKFTTLCKTQRENNNDIFSNQHEQPTRITRSNSTSPTISSRTAIFSKVCSFYNKER